MVFEVPKISFKVFLATVVPMPMVFEVLLVPVVLRVCEVQAVPEVPMRAPSVVLDAKSGLVVLGEVSERSGFLCRIGGFIR